MTQTGKITGQSGDGAPAATIQFPAHRSRRSQLAHVLSSNWLLCVLVGGVALGFDLYRLGNPSIWFDEAFSVELARQPLPLLWHIIWGPEPNMELYYLFLHFWLGLTGLFGLLPTEWVVRAPSAVFAALSSVMVFLLGRRYLGIVAGLVGAGLYTLNFLQLVYAQQTRSYSLQLLLICIAWYALFAVFTQETHTRRWWICFIFASALAIYAHLFSLLILASQLVAFVGLLFLPGPWRSIARRHLRAFIASLVAITVLTIPMLLVSRNGPKTGWLPIPHLHDIVHLFQTITTNSALYLLLLFIFCAFALFIALIAYVPDFAPLLARITCYRASDESGEPFASQPASQPDELRSSSAQAGCKERGASKLRQLLPIAFALICWLFVPIIISYVVSQGSTRLFSTRYLVTILPPLFLLVGLAVAVLRWRAIKIALALGLILIALSYVPVYYRSAQVEDWNSTVHWLQQRYQPGDGLVCFDNDVQQGCQISVEYYLHAYQTLAHFTADAPGAFSWENFGPVDLSTGPQAAVDPIALAAYAAKHPHVFFIVGRLPDDTAVAQAKAAQQWLDSHYRLLGRIHTPTVTISLYATNAQGT